MNRLKGTETAEPGERSVELMHINMDREAAVWLNDHFEEIDPAVAKLADPEAICKRIFAVLLANTIKGTLDEMVFTKRLHVLTLKHVKEQIPNIPDKAAEIICGFCASQLSDMFKEHPEPLRELFGQFGIRIHNMQYLRNKGTQNEPS